MLKESSKKNKDFRLYLQFGFATMKTNFKAVCQQDNGMKKEIFYDEFCKTA